MTADNVRDALARAQQDGMGGADKRARDAAQVRTNLRSAILAHIARDMHRTRHRSLTYLESLVERKVVFYTRGEYRGLVGDDEWRLQTVGYRP